MRTVNGYLYILHHTGRRADIAHAAVRTVAQPDESIIRVAASRCRKIYRSLVCCANARKQRLVAVEEEHSVLRQSRSYFKLCLCDILACPEIFKMRRTDIRYHRDIGACRKRHRLYLAESAHAHFKNGIIGIIPHLKHRKRHAYDTVAVALCAVHLARSRKHRRYEFLCRCFSDAARNGNTPRPYGIRKAARKP